MTLDERQLKQRLTRFWDQEARFYDPVDAINAAIKRTRQPQAFRHRTSSIEELPAGALQGVSLLLDLTLLRMLLPRQPSPRTPYAGEGGAHRFLMRYSLLSA